MRREFIIAVFFVFSCLFAASNKLSVQAKKIDQLRDPFQESVALQNTKRTGLSTGYVGRGLFIYDLKYRDAVSMIRILKEIDPALVASAEQEGKRILIKATAAEYKKYAEKISELDIPLDQILIEVKVLEINHNNLDKLGIKWDLDQNGVMLSERKRAEDFIKGVDLLLGNGSAKLMANPRVATVIGKEAVIHIGDQVPYAVPVEYSNSKTSWQINYISAGIDLKITPQKADPGYIGLVLNPEVASIKQWKSTPAGDYPIISSRKIQTFLCLKNNESFVIGGLLNEEERENTNKIPVLGDIPLLNIFFINKSVEKIRSDVVFLVTAKKI